ncbi:MAG TPA: ferredoxin [Patescibacteria group bacterium]
MAKMKKVTIDQDKCIGCNTCPLIAPDVFELDTNDYKAKVKKQPEIIGSDVENAVVSCPVGAISIDETEE